MSLHSRKTVLFITIAEAGQSNTIFALALELLTHPNVDVHVASFPVLRKRAEKLSTSACAVERKHPGSTFAFQEISGMALREAAELGGVSEATWSHPPLARTRDEGLNKLNTIVIGWNGKGTIRYFWPASPSIQIEFRPSTVVAIEYVRVVNSCKGIIGAVNPEITVVDSSFNAA
jgi:hypothetical protein